MNEITFDTLTRGAVGISRRGSLAMVGSVTLAALPFSSHAKTRKAGKTARKTCRKQGKQCHDFLAAQGAPDYFRCCPYFARCNVADGLLCMLET